MRNFCTYFDSAYIWKGLALYESLKAVSDDFCLYVMALDDKSFQFLKQHECESLKVDTLADVETPELLSLKAGRTRAEYCWTCGPAIILYIIAKYDLPDVTYLDSDLMFFSSFQPLYDEIGDSSVAITPQYSTQDELAGKYCVQFMFFRRDDSGMACLRWWRDECFKWCYARYEDGKYGDQKYLDEFPVRFQGVKIIENRGAGVATWNMHLYQYADGQVVFQGQSWPLVFFHFHGLRMSVEGDTLLMKLIDSQYTAAYGRLFYQPYMQLVCRNLQKYFHQDVSRCRLEQQSLFSRCVGWFKKRLRNISLVRRIYFRFHTHESWEQSKL